MRTRWLGLLSRMILLMDALEAAEVHMGIDLGCCDAGVPEEFLNDAQVGASFEQVRGEAMP